MESINAHFEKLFKDRQIRLVFKNSNEWDEFVKINQEEDLGFWWCDTRPLDYHMPLFYGSGINIQSEVPNELSHRFEISYGKLIYARERKCIKFEDFKKTLYNNKVINKYITLGRYILDE